MITNFEIEDQSENKVEMTGEYLYVKVKNIDVKIKCEDEGVVVDLYPNKSTDTEPITSTYASFAEATENED